MEKIPLKKKYGKEDIFLNALAEAYRLQESIISTTELSIISTNTEGLITSFNKAAEKLTGYGAEEMIGKTSLIVLHDNIQLIERADALSSELGFEVEPNFEVLSTKAKLEKIADRREWVYIRKDGTRFTVLLSITGIRDDNNVLSGFAGIATDITESKQAEEELQKVAEENYQLFNNAVTLNVIAGFDGYFKRLNPTWTQLLGWTEEELKSKGFIEFVHPDDVLATRNAVSFLREGNHLLSFENHYRCKDGTYRCLLWAVAADVKNQLIYASAIDITARKKSEEELLRSKQNIEAIALKLQEQNRQLDEFAHIISHNLRSPIGNIKALIGLLDSNSTIAEYQQIFEKLKNVSKNLGETMNELMETLKVKKETTIERVELRFKEIFDKVVQSMEGELIQTEAHITFDFNEAPTIIYSRSYLESIFQNLLNNAIKYRSPERKPQIKVTTSLQGKSIILRVGDNGQGIDLNKFGDKLFGLHKTFHEHKDARGVGLFLVKTQIEVLGGSIEAESEIDKGTTFIIRF